MKLFGQLVRTAVNLVLLPVDAAKDTLMAPVDAGEGKKIGQRTSERIEKLKDEAGE